MGMTGTAGNAVGKRRHRRHAVMAEINVTPMVDVMLVLLIIFMITAPLLQVGVPVDLPKTSAQQVGGKDEPLVVSVKRWRVARVRKKRKRLVPIRRERVGL